MAKPRVPRATKVMNEITIRYSVLIWPLFSFVIEFIDYYRGT